MRPTVIIVMLFVGLFCYVGLGVLVWLRRRKRGEPAGEYMDTAWEKLTSVFSTGCFMFGMLLHIAGQPSAAVTVCLGGILWIMVKLNRLLRQLQHGSLMMPTNLRDLKIKKLTVTVDVGKTIEEFTGKPSDARMN